MLVSFNWLKQYVDLPDSVTPEEVALKLTMSTVEVEKTEKSGENLENIVVGEVKKLNKHPDADKLQLVIVSDGKDEYQVVCGGSNLREGMKVAFAKVGAKVRWHGEGKLVTLEKAKIRGVESFGMICASTEIGLGEMFPLKSEKEILDLSFTKAIVGSPLSATLGLDDTVFDIDNKSMTHRPDLWGHYGLAREVAALYGKRLKDYKTKRLKDKKKTEIDLTVKVEDEKLCPRYMAVAIDGVEIKPSPAWMQTALRSCGVRPINNIVDITNYLLLDLGQPMHAFDNSKLKVQNSKVAINVRSARKMEKFVTLDEKRQELDESILVIANEEKVLALAGVMGGLDSGISDETKTIIFESANFNAANIRRTAVKLGLRTESSARFEKSLDPYNAELVLKRAVELTLEFCPGAKVSSKVVDAFNFKLNQGPIELSLDFLNKKIGMKLDKKQVIKILNSLGFSVKDKKDKLSVIVPTWRATKDISIPEDLVEEVARIYGYGNISSSLPSFPIVPPLKNELRCLERKAKEILAWEFNFSEVYNYSFVNKELLEKIGEDVSKHLELANPLAKDRPLLRRHLLPNLLLNVESNLHRFDEVKLFEIGKTFIKENGGPRASDNGDELLPQQNVLLGLVCARQGDKTPFYAVSEAISGLIFRLGAELNFKRSKHSHLVNNGRFAEIFVNGEKIGFIGEMDTAAQKRLGIEERVGLAEIDLNILLGLLQNKSSYRALPVYPEAVRDIAFIVDEKTEHATVVKALGKADALVVGVELFDVYNPSAALRPGSGQDAQGKGKSLLEGKKSFAYHIIYQSPERTLTSEEVDKVQEKVVKVIEKEFGGEVRK